MSNLQLTQPAEQLLAGDAPDSVANNNFTPIQIGVTVCLIDFRLIAAWFVHVSYCKRELFAFVKATLLICSNARLQGQKLTFLIGSRHSL
jgi:hypothetical protein